MIKVTHKHFIDGKQVETLKFEAPYADWPTSPGLVTVKIGLIERTIHVNGQRSYRVILGATTEELSENSPIALRSSTDKEYAARLFQEYKELALLQESAKRAINSIHKEPLDPIYLQEARF